MLQGHRQGREYAALIFTGAGSASVPASVGSTGLFPMSDPSSRRSSTRAAGRRACSASPFRHNRHRKPKSRHAVRRFSLWPELNAGKPVSPYTLHKGVRPRIAHADRGHEQAPSEPAEPRRACRVTSGATSSASGRAGKRPSEQTRGTISVPRRYHCLIPADDRSRSAGR